MRRKLPDDSFEYYFGLGMERSYQAVAEHFGVAKKTVAARAKSEQWQERLAERERKARDAYEKKAVETIEAMQERHLKMLKVVQSKALEALASMPLQTAYQAVQALAKALDQERVIRGEPSDRTALDIESLIKREYEQLVLKPGEEEDWGDAAGSDHPALQA